MLWSARDGLLQSDRLDLPGAQLPPGWRGVVGSAGLGIAFDRGQSCLSSAVANGGLVRTDGFLNMHLREDCPLEPEGPTARLARETGRRGLPANSVGMMTGASMRSLRLASAAIDDHVIAVFLTAGLANARRAGDRAEQRSLHGSVLQSGTINLALASSAPLTTAAMAETLATLTEARAATLQTLGVASPVSGGIATGTGTDATAVFCPPDGNAIAYTGKHTLFGETAACLVMETLTDSLAPAPEAADVG